MVAASSYLAFWLRFDSRTPAEQADLWLGLLPLLLLIRGVTFARLRLYEGLWRYTSIWDLRNIILGVAASTGAFFVIVHFVLDIVRYPRSIVIIDTVLLVCLMGGVRLSRRIFREISPVRHEKSVLIYGAGDAGELIVRDMKNNAFYDYEPIGFVDDDPTKVGLRIHGVPVLGTRHDLVRIIDTFHPTEVLVAIPRAEPSVLRAVVRSLAPFKIQITTLPNLRDLLDGRVTISQIRKLAVEDLLARAPVGLNPKPVRRLVEGRRVLVTGAGGSIGGELCRQIAACRPALLVLFERYENSLYAITNELHDSGICPASTIRPVIGDVTDTTRVHSILAQYHPEIVFHAAAHKHVPLMESNPCEAIKNNVGGTRILAEAAEEHGVSRFVLISSDKAVNPTSVMGATKRIAELMLQARANASSTSFIIVRFGNVLGSSGSVVPRFLDQIKAGGPVTVTHPEMRRYFMLIPEAVQLVLHAAAQGEAAAVYVLDMGEQVKLIDLARDLIRLSGSVPDNEIQIVFTGLRPGEKLFEEIVGRDETAGPSKTEKILRVQAKSLPQPEEIAARILALERLALAGDASSTIAELVTIVPEYCPNRQVEHLVPVDAVETHETVRGTQQCPACGSANFHRSKARSARERVTKFLRTRRLHRCRTCGWRGWVDLIDSFEPMNWVDEQPARLDLSPLDAVVPLGTSMSSLSSRGGALR
jgi:FlaA1/EpsC-like NDP-sugar epimerase